MGRPKLDMNINIHRDKAALLSVSIGAIDDVIRTSLMGSGVGNYRDQNGDDYDIMIRLDTAATPDINNINNLLQCVFELADHLTGDNAVTYGNVYRIEPADFRGRDHDVVSRFGKALVNHGRTCSDRAARL